MKKYSIGILLLLLLILPSRVLAADISTSTCPGAGCVDINVAGQGSLGIQIIGTWAGTITFQSSLSTVSGGIFDSLLVTPSGSTTAVITTTANGVWSVPVAGFSQVRVVFTSYSSGTAVVVFRSTNQARANTGSSGGGGGSGTVTQVDTTGPIGGGPITTTGTITCSTCGVTGSPLSQFAATTSLQLKNTISDETGSGLLVFATSPTFTTPLLGTPTSGNLVNTTGYPVASLDNLGTGVATWLATPSSANLASAVTGETGSGALVFGTTPTLTTPVIGAATGTSLVLTGGVTTGSGSGVAGVIDLAQGTLPSSFPANSFSLYAPTSISSSYQWRVPTADAAGAIISSGAGVLSINSFSGTGNIIRAVGPTFTGSNTFTLGTITASTPIITATETRNSSGVTFQGIVYAVTSTAAANASTLIDLQTGSAATRLAFFPNPAGYSLAENAGLLYAGIFQSARIAIDGTSTGGVTISAGSPIRWGTGTIKYDGAVDTGLIRNAAGLVEVNNATAGTIRDFKARNYVTTVGSNIASSGTIAPTSGITHITGTTTVSTITVPTNIGQTSTGGCLTLIPDGIFLTDTMGNIALASTAIVGKALIMCYDNGTTKWYPSY